MPRLAALALAATFVLVAATPAHAGLSTWSSLPGLNSVSGADWVRVYATGATPNVIYAGTEGDGVFRSVTGGVTWAPFGTGLENFPGAKDVRTVFTAGGKVLAGTGAGLFSSTGGAWSPVAQGAEDDPANPVKLNHSVQTVLSGPVGGLLAGTFGAGVYKSSDDGQTWKPPAPGNGMPAGETVWSLASFANFIFAATSSGIYRSFDFGSTWTLASDGIPGSATTLRVFGDDKAPNIYYAGTAGNGIYRSINGGITWAPINAGLGNLTVRGLQPLFGVDQTRLYAATGDGLWVGTTDHGPLPGPVKWRHVTETGLGNNTIMWAVNSFTLPLGTLLVGTQSNGGYALTFEPALNDQAPAHRPVILGNLQVGAQMLALPGTWTGTPQIDFAYQWQRCQTAAGSCGDIAGADGQAYTVVPADQTKYLRVVVTGSNDFPSFGPVNKAWSAISGSIDQEPGPLPGDNQQSAPSIGVDAPGNPSLPEVGDTLNAKNWLFNPAATVSTSFQWLRCDENGNDCEPIPAANALKYKLVTADGEHRLRVRVTGKNGFGSTTLPDSGTSNVILPLPASNTSPPAISGDALVGSSLIGGVGTWVSPKTTFARQWELCEADGSGCSPIGGKTSPTYVPTAGDRGMRVRLTVKADVNESFKLPLAVEVHSALSDVIADPPVPPLPPVPPVDGLPGVSDTPGAEPAPSSSSEASVTPPAVVPSVIRPPAVAPAAPALLQLAAKAGATSETLSFALAAPGSLTVVVQRRVTGRRSGKRCVTRGAPRGARSCTLYRTVKTIVRRGLAAGAGKVSIPTRGLAAGSYRAVVTPSDATGRKGKARNLAFKVKSRSRR